MNLMLTALLSVTAIALTGSPVLAASPADSPLVGHWLLEVDSLPMPPEARPKSVSIVFAAMPDGKWNERVEIIDPNGKPMHSESTLSLDGTPGRASGTYWVDVLAAKMPEPDVLVVLHTDTDSTGFTAGRPAYFTRTDEGGAYSLRNLREGQYRLHALKDQNANFRNDLPNERVAFADSLADAQDSATHVLRMFLPLAATQQVKEAAVQPDRSWRIVLARPVDTLLSLTSIDRQFDGSR